MKKIVVGLVVAFVLISCAEPSDNSQTSSQIHIHSYGAWSQTKAPTVTADGIETRTCTTCGKKETRSIPATGGTVLNSPTGVSATAQSSSSIRVQWVSVSGATSYDVYYEIGSSSTKNFAGNAISTSYTHTGLQANTTYYYYIKAKNSTSESNYSSYSLGASATTQSSSSGTTGGSVRIVNNSSRQILNMTIWKNKNTLDGITLFSYNSDYTLINSNSSMTINNVPSGYYGAGVSGASSSQSFSKSEPITITTGTQTTITINNSDW